MPRSAPGPRHRARRRAARARRVGRVEPGDDAQQRRLAAAGRAEDGDEVVVARPRASSAPARASARRRARRESTRDDALDDELAHARLHGKQPAVDRLEQEVGDQPDHADDDDAEDDLAGGEQRLAVDDHVADAGGRADQLGDDHVGPGPAEHEAQDLGDLRRSGRDQHARDDALVAGAERVGGLDQVAPRVADRDRDHQDDLEHRADEDDQQLLHLADAGPQDQQRDEGGGRQVAREGDERLEERLDRLVGAHQDAERHGDQRRQDEAADARARSSCRCRTGSRA